MNNSTAGGAFLRPRMDIPQLEAVYYIKLLLLPIGLVGNSLGFYIWMTKDFRKMPHSVAFLTLALANTLYLIHHSEISTSLHFFKEDILMTSDLSCQMTFCLFKLSLQLDSWSIVLLSIERSIGTQANIITSSISCVCVCEYVCECVCV